MSADELRTAAATLRERANKVRRPFTAQEKVDIALADWLDVVAERHKSDGTEELTLHLDTECSVCDDGGHEVVVCAGCYPTWDGMDGRSIYPCAEVKAALPVARLINGGAS